MIASFANQTVTRLRAATSVDSYKNIVRHWDDVDSADVKPCTVQPVSGSVTFDTEGGRMLARWSLHAPADADIEDYDRIVYDGDEYDIDGAVQRFPSPSGQLAHIEIILKRRKHA